MRSWYSCEVFRWFVVGVLVCGCPTVEPFMRDGSVDATDGSIDAVGDASDASLDAAGDAPFDTPLLDGGTADRGM